MKRLYLIALSILLLALMTSCGRKYKKTPIDNYIVQHTKQKNFSVILDDMDVEGTFFKTHKMKFKVILEDEEGTPTSADSDWQEVSEDFFFLNENNLGMTLLLKKDGKVDRNASPPGYQYVNNAKYGEWRSNAGGHSFWAFYGQYMFMSHMFGMMNRPVYQNGYNSYRSGYAGKRSYYGKTSGGKPAYGTNSAATRKLRPNFYQRKATKSGWISSRGRSGLGSRSSGRGK
tara:strand:- start:471 stop:1160 length:690 start_codon:yes stop_codon:yes gene_type:complete